MVCFIFVILHVRMEEELMCIVEVCGRKMS